MATLGKNQVFEIKNGDGTSFHNLVLRKSAVESIVMSLGDKISGDVYYKDNSLSVTMHEYITYNGVNYMLVNPPTIVREGIVSDNSELKGMTKYSFVFYHPMCQLANFPFLDVAVTSDETRYLSEGKTFSWIGKPADFVAKLNKNLTGTEWIVELSPRFPQDKLNELSDVIPFDNATIADACKTFYDTWGVPYVVDKVASTEASYATGKRFKLVMGLPSNEIYENASAEQQNIPFVFQMGHGVGLKNNSRTPRNNKIITRISGYGSENNIPYGYPQVRWYGTAGQSFTYGDHAGVYTDVTIGGVHFDKVVSYPIYKGILNGEYVELIKHPFTRTHLMPSVYRTTLFNKISLYDDLGEVNTDYDPDITLVDYYDAIYSAQYPYPNTINLHAPSYESHEFEDEKPELGEAHIISATPLNNDLTPASSWDDSLDDEGNYKQSYFQMVLPQLSFDLYACASITEEMQINMRSGACLGCTFTVQVDWDDYKRNFYDKEGNFAPNGSQRDLTKYPKSNQGSISLVLQKDNSTFGTLMPNMYQYPKGETSTGAGNGDTFVILGISLPESYILAAEDRLDVDMKSYMLENNEHYFDYPLKFDEDFLFHNENILSQIRPNTVVRFNYAGQTLALFVKQITVKYGDQPLPQYDITLTDNVEVVLNQIGQVAEDVEKLSTLIAILRQSYGKNVWNELAKKLSKTQDDTAAGYITMLKGLQVGANFVPDILGEGGVLRMREDGKVELVTDILYARMRAYFDSVVIREYRHESGNRIKSPAQGFNASRVENIKVVDNVETIVDDASEADYFRCYWRVDDGERKAENQFVVGDLAFCEHTEVVDGTLETKRYWRVVTGRNAGNTTTADGEAWIDLSNAHDANGNPVMTTISWEGQGGTTQTKSVLSFESGSGYPEAHDDICMLGCVVDTTRQGAIIEYVSGVDAPTYQIYQGLGSDATNPYVLTNKNQITIGYNSATGKADMKVYGDAYIGARDRSTFIEYKQSGTGGNPELNIKAHVEFTNSDAELDTLVQNHQRDDSYDDAWVHTAVSDLQSQIDGEIDSWFYNYLPVSDITSKVPLTNVEPYKTWYEADGGGTETEVTTERIKHLGDTFYDNSSGYAFRFSRNEETDAFEWVVITDSAVIRALANAAKAQETADGKHANYSTWEAWVKNNINTLQVGDLYIPSQDYTDTSVTPNKTYKANKVYKCTTAATNAFEEVAYTDDTKADSILNNTYYKQLAGGTINGLIGTAQSTAEAAAGIAAAAKTSADAANTKLTAWADDGKISPTEKLALKNQKADVQKEYAQIIADAAKYSGVSTTAFTTAYNKAITAFNYYTSTDTENIDIITDEEEDSDATPRYSRIADYYAARQTILEAITTAAKSYATTQGNKFLNDAVYKAISAALGSKTDIVGGLVLTSLIGMRQQNEGGTYTVWGGISGEYDDWSGETHAKGHGIAAWYGGELLDKETLTTEQIAQGWDTLRWAKGVDRFDGSGYRANGNITWDETGALTIKNITTLSDSNNNNILNELATFNSAFTFGTSGQGSTTALYITPNVPFQSLYIGTSNANKKEVATQEWVGNNYVSTAFFRQLFRAFKPNATAGQADVEVQPNTIDATISNIKAMVGFWTEQYVSALGNNSDGGGGGASVLYGLNDVTPNATGDGVMGAQDGYVLTYNGSTNHWYAAPTPETYVLPTATAAALGGIKIGYAASGKNYAIVLDANGKAYVNVPWTDTTYTLAGLMGSTAIGGATQPIYWDGSAFKKTTYTLAKSVPADAKFTDTTYSFSNADATLAWSTRTKIATTGGTDIYVTMPANPNTNTWRNIYLGGTSKVGTATNTKALNFLAGSNIDITYTAAGTGEGQSGSADYFNIEIKAKNVYDSSTSRTKNTVLAAPNGSNGAATFRSLVAADIPSLAASKITSGTFDTARIPTLAISKISGLQDALDSKLDKSFFHNLFRAHKTVSGVDTVISANGDLTDAESIEAMFGFWTEQYISSLGQGSDGGGAGQGDVTWDLLASSSDTRQIALSHLTTALAGYSTTSHTHTTTIAADSGTNQLTLAYGTKYKITAGGTSFIFTMPSADDTNTWRNIYVAGTQQITTAVNTKGLNFAAGNNVSLSFAAAGTGSGQSGNANYGTLTISATDTTYSAATQSAAGLMSAADKKKLDGIAEGANKYSLPLAASGTRGGVQIGYTTDATNRNYAVQLSSEKMYVNVPWENTTYSAGTGISFSGTTINNSGVRAATINGNYLRVNTNGTNADLTIPYATNSDTVDGYHENSFFRYRGNIDVNYVDLTTYTANATNYQNPSNGVWSVQRQGYSAGLITFTGSASASGLDIYFHYAKGADFKFRRRIDSNRLSGDWETFITSENIGSQSVNYATSAGNAASATKLQTSRTIWGQSFDGTANVSGDMTGVGSITASGDNTITKDGTGAIKFAAKNDNSQIELMASSNTSRGVYDRTKTTWLIYTNGTNTRLMLGNVGIGTTSPAYKLDVAGTFYASGNSSIGGTFGVTGATTLSSTLAVTGATTLTGLLTANGNIATGTSDGAYIQIGGARIVWDNTNSALKVIKSDNSTAANFYATGAISALGQGVDGGGGGGQGDVTWDLLSRTATGGRFIDSSYISGTLANYLPKTGGTMTGALTINPSNVSSFQDGIILNDNGTGASEALTIKWTSATYTTGNKLTADLANKRLIFHNGTSWYNVLTSGDSSVSKSGETLTVKINGTSYSLTNTNTTYSAGKGLRLSGTQFISDAPRVAKDSKVFGGQNTWIMEEYTAGANYNLPSNSWYHIMSTQGADTAYGTQLALGMTTEQAYYRVYNNGSWGNWKSLINTWRGIQNNLTSDSTSDSLSAAQGKALANGSARDSTKLPLAGGTMNDGAVIARSGKSISWYKGRLHPIIKTTSYTGYNSILSMKTENGSWDLGVYTGDKAYLTYITDTNYNAGSNNATYQLIFPQKNGTLAVTGDIPTYTASNGITLNGTTFSNSGVRATTINGNYLRVNTNGTNADLTIPYATNADTVDNLHASDFVRAYGTTNDNIDSDWGQSFKTFDPIPSGNPPAQNANISTINIGNNFNRRKQLAFLYNVDDIYYRRRAGGTWSSWVKLIHSGNIGSQSVSYATTSGACSGNAATATNADKLDGYHATSFMSFSDTTDYVNCDFVDGNLAAKAVSKFIEFYQGGWFNFKIGTLYCGHIYATESVRFATNTYRVLELKRTDSCGSGIGFLKGDTLLGDVGFEGGGNFQVRHGSSTIVTLTVDTSGNLTATGGVTCLTSTSSSDIRLKDVQGNVNLNVEQVADAPAVRFLWKKDHSLGMQAGSIAQYWQNVLPETIKEDREGFLSLNYGVAALVSAITTARKVVDHEKEIAQLKNRVKALEDENEMLKTKLIA